MTHDDTLKRAAALLRHMSDAGSTDEYRSCNDCATAIDALREELARQVPFAWATFDGEQSYDLRLYEENEDYREDYIKRNGEKYASWVTPLYTAPQPAQVPVQHPDDEAVDRFAAAMKAKLAKARDAGRSGWQDPAWPVESIGDNLREHVEKGDPRDVANYCMFLFERGERIPLQRVRVDAPG